MKRKEEIEEFIKFNAHKFGVRNGYETIEELMMEMAQWCDNNPKSPWISVKDRLPEDGDIVITRIVHVVKGGGEHRESVQHLEQMYRGRWCTDSMEQHRRNGILYDCISEVTNWMPIPELPKGE